MRTGIRGMARLWSTPRSVDLAAQVAFWFAFVFGYQLIQAGAGHDRGRALADGLRVVELERDLVHGLVELRLQEIARDSGAVDTFVALTYWSSEFAVVALALLWVYLRRPRAFRPFRNTLIATNVIALVGFYAFPTAPPREFATLGFVDTVRSSGAPGHGQGLLPLPSNQNAAMPSLHSADALIVGVGLALLVRSRPVKAACLLWPLAVWFSVLATGNHFWLDAVAGIVVAGIGGLLVATLGAAGLPFRRLQRTGLRGEFGAVRVKDPPEGRDGEPFSSEEHQAKAYSD
jgi:membrane-associated phospholipid phosphatase